MTHPKAIPAESNPDAFTGFPALRGWGLPPLFYSFLALTLLAIADVASTVIGIRVGLSEGNPIAAPLIHAGPWALLTAKVVAILAVAWIAWAMHERGYTAYARAGVIMGSMTWAIAVTVNTWNIMETT